MFFSGALYISHYVYMKKCDTECVCVVLLGNQWEKQTPTHENISGCMHQREEGEFTFFIRGRKRLRRISESHN